MIVDLGWGRIVPLSMPALTAIAARNPMGRPRCMVALLLQSAKSLISSGETVSFWNVEKLYFAMFL